MNAISSIDELYNLWWLLDQTRHALFKVRQNELRKYDISVGQAAILHIVNTLGNDATRTTISRWLFREPHYVSESLQAMGRKGLVKTIKNPEVSKQLRVELTDKGRKAYHESAKRESTHDIMSLLSEEERKMLWRCLETLLVKVIDRYGMKDKIVWPLP